MSQVSICPTVTAFGAHDYREQMELLEKFAERIHIDLMDGVFAPTKSPDLDQIWWRENMTADIHLMYQKPSDVQDELIKFEPNLVVVHFESEVDYADFAYTMQLSGIKAGLAILADTPVEECMEVLKYYDHALVFSGKLGFHGGTIDLGLLEKVAKIRQAYPNIEIGWDGGINDQNARQLIDGGANVLNVGGFIHNAADPQKAYGRIKTLTEA